MSGTSAHSVHNYGESYVEGLNQLSAGHKNVNQGSKVELTADFRSMWNSQI